MAELTPRLTPGRFLTPWGGPVCRAVLKRQPEDFRVTEVLGFTPDGAGEHLWLWVEKTGLNTDRVARHLAAALGLPLPAVSWSGLKDRHAVTGQWFSVHWPGGGDWPLGDAWQQDETGRWRVTQAVRSSRKLRRGAHAANAFVITLRDVQGEHEAIEARLGEMRAQGVPNHFGLQRFGHGARNLDQGLALLADRRAGRRRRRDNRESLWISALRSALFNHVLDRRVGDGSWTRWLPGDVLQLDGRGSLFAPTEADRPDALARLDAQALHVTGPMPGEGAAVVSDAVATLEAEVLAPWQTVCDDLAALRVPAQRRALRLRIEDMRWQWSDADTLTLSFTLTAGAFATSMLQCLAYLDEEQSHALSAEQ